MPRDRRSRWIAHRCHTAALACALIAACSEQPEQTEHRIVVVPAKPAPTRTTSAAVTPQAIATPSPMPERPRRAFVDPPLPAELIDPPGLLPLPPRPTFTDHQQGEMP
jgi:hypothetical protein